MDNLHGLTEEINNISQCSATDNKRASIHDLPYNVMLKIFEHLTVDDLMLDIALVCKYWHELCFYSTFKNQMNFEGRHLVDHDTIIQTLKYSRHIKKLSLRSCHNDTITDETIETVAKSCGNLREVNLTNASRNLTCKCVISLAEHCPNITHLHLESFGVNDQVLYKIAENLAHLESLYINQNRDVTDNGLIQVLSCCSKLHTLSANRLEQVTDKTLEAIKERELENPRLKVLSLAMNKLTGCGVRSIGVATNLTMLDLTRVKLMSYDDIVPLAFNLTGLTYLALCMQAQIDDQCLEIIARNMSKLEQLLLISTSVSDKGVEYVVDGCKSLHTIDIGYSNVSQKGCLMLCENLPSIEKIGMMSCKNANDDELNLLADKFPNIMIETFAQNMKRLLQSHGVWPAGGFETLKTPEGVKCLDNAKPRLPKPRRIPGSGGKLDYSKRKRDNDLNNP